MAKLVAEPEEDEEPTEDQIEQEERKAKYHPDNANEAIGKLMADTPDSFPAKTDVAQEVGVVGGSKYKMFMDTYDQRRTSWEVKREQKSF